VNNYGANEHDMKRRGASRNSASRCGKSRHGQSRRGANNRNPAHRRLVGRATHIGQVKDRNNHTIKQIRRTIRTGRTRYATRSAGTERIWPPGG
jgi:hypothetical protein